MKAERDKAGHAGRFAAALRAAGDLPRSPSADDVRRAMERRLSSVMSSVPLLRTGYEEPTHLAAMADAYQRAQLAARGEGPPVLATFSAPSQVGKSSLGEVAYARWIAEDPSHYLGSLSYGQDLADGMSRRIRDDVIALGVPLRGDSSAVDQWHTHAGGGLLSRGLMGGITGQPGLVCLRVDDPYRNRMEAESIAHKRRVNDAVRSVVFTRRNPRTSVIITHTRWAPDDVIGFLEKELGERFEHHRCPAVDDHGNAVVTIGGRTAEFWSEQRALMGEHDWWSLMMGLPRAREGALFKAQEGATYTALPHAFDAIGIGLDFGYSSKKTSDPSAIVVIGRVGHLYYILHCEQTQCSAPDFAKCIRGVTSRYPTARKPRAYIGGTERGTTDFFAREGIYIEALPATLDKRSRATSAIGAWERGHVLMPMSATWADGLLSELLDFTGAPGGKDNRVDALVGAFDGCGRASLEVSSHLALAVSRAYEAPVKAVEPFEIRRRYQ